MADYTRQLAADASITPVDNNDKAEAGAEPPMVQVAEFQDLFGDVLDAHWTEGATSLPEAGTLVESDGKWTITVPNVGAAREKGAYTGLVFNDITTEIDCANFTRNATPLAANGLWFFIFKDVNNCIRLNRYWDFTAGLDIVECHKRVGSVWTLIQRINTAVTSFKFKIVRGGDNWDCYYDIGAGWVQFGVQFAAAIGADCRIFISLYGDKNTASVDVNEVLVDGSNYYWSDSPEADIVDSAHTGVGESYAYDAGVDNAWSLTGASSVEDGDGGTNKWKVGFSDAADGTGITWDAAWRTIAEVNTNAGNGDYDGHRYLYVKWQGNSDGTQNVNATSFTISGTAGSPTHTWTQSDTEAKEGTYSHKQVGPIAQADDYYAQRISVIPGEDYYVEIHGSCTVAPSAGYFYLQAYDITGAAEIDISKLSVQSADFVKFSFYFTAPAGCAIVEIRYGGNTEGGTTYWDAADGIRLRAKDYT